MHANKFTNKAILCALQATRRSCKSQREWVALFYFKSNICFVVFQNKTRKWTHIYLNIWRKNPKIAANVIFFTFWLVFGEAPPPLLKLRNFAKFWKCFGNSKKLSTFENFLGKNHSIVFTYSFRMNMQHVISEKCNKMWSSTWTIFANRNTC